MTWVKRGGGTGRGFYGLGLSAAGNAAEEHESPARPNLRETDSAGRGHDAQDEATEHVPAPAYRVTQWSQVRDNKIMLDLLAHGVATQGWEPEMSIYYEDALATFGADSMHFTAACKGQSGAGGHYQKMVAGGRFRNVD